ncbi:MAG: glycosyltransferase family 4 protein [Candidatus Moraniibacteriota bacterium]|nr:MAG: glycosyltransferase family 4 protein [Candidatus Moranbacteria bacterium]
MSTPIKILLATRPLVPPWDEASKNFAYFLAKSIRDPQLEFHLLTANETLEELGTNCVQHPIFRSGRFNFEAKARLAAFLGTKGRTFDMVHFLFTPTPFNSFLSKHLIGTHPKTIQTIATLREERWNESDWKRMFFADRLITYTEYSKQKLQSVGLENVERIYPGIDLERFSPRPKDPETLKKLNISPADFVISYAGEYARLGATDMIADMLVKHVSRSPSRHSREGGNPDTTSQREALASRVCEDIPLSQQNLDPIRQLADRMGGEDMKFLFALRIKNDADQKKKEEITEKFRKAGILDQVRFSDTVSDVAALYNIADIVTFPVSNMHGKFDVPLVILEAYACGRPVILSDLPIFEEFSNPQISATIPRDNGDALWSAIESLRANEAKRNALGTNARAFVERSFDLKETAKEYEKLYCELSSD